MAAVKKYTEPKIIKPTLIVFEVTRRCLFHCQHCRAETSSTETQKDLTTHRCKRILTSVADYNSKCTVMLAGGEPMERNDIYELIRYGRSLGLRMEMATCGYLIDDESIKQLKKTRIRSLSFPLDGASDQTHDEFRQTSGAFNFIINAAHLAQKTGIKFQINTMISKSNINELIAIANLATKLGAYRFNPFILVPIKTEETTDQIVDPIVYEALLNELLQIKLQGQIDVNVTCSPQFARVCQQAKAKKLISNVSGCMGGKDFGFISYRGDVQVCGFMNIPAGNLTRKRYDFEKIWSKSKLLNDIRNLSQFDNKCSRCTFIKACGGCRARAFVMTGDYLASDPACNYISKRK